ncbi:hypothetical protein [Eubacterium barkeri]|uniref:Uncharacterized membrane protein YkvI n=1 Tax=Eubacterium barkeri TaxID=1528 RepID=A0A1H3I4L6_EUBBA|nr:hypothetical protein [Eubacterium barkeri]SDY22646.1 Uncharacterized membrane protein YkvI [Eubacterium barkeri]
MENKGKKSALIKGLLGPISIGCVWYGAQMGSGTASGANQMTYFVRFGWIGLFTTVLAIAVQVWFFYWGIELSRVSGQHHYQGWIRELVYPLDKFCVPLFDVLCLLIFPIFTGSCMAGSAQVLTDYLGMNYTIALVAIMVVFVLMAAYGTKIISTISSGLTLTMVVVLIVTLVLGIPSNWDNIVLNFNNRVTGEGMYSSIPMAFWYAVLFISTQTVNLSGLPAVTKGVLKSKQDTKIVCIVATVCVMITMFGLSLLLFGRFPGNLDAVIYTLEAVNDLNSPFIYYAYPILLFCAFISTGPIFVYGQADRWSNAKFWDKLKETNLLKQKQGLRMALVGALFVIMSFLYSTLGFGFVTTTLFAWQSYVWIPIALIPLIFIAPFRVRRMRRQLETTGKVTTAASIRAAEQEIAAKSHSEE